MPRPLENLAGRTYGSWTVIARSFGHPDSRETMWTCRCDCGAEGDVAKSNLTRGLSTQCRGCRARASRKPARPSPVRKPRATGADHHLWRGTSITYGTAHKRVSSQRGPASGHPCVDCGEPAADWSRDEVFCPTRMIDPAGRPYCTHVEHYAARCRTCHNRLDHP